jgi:uncharacterized protein YggT (Ycf19 family)
VLALAYMATEIVHEEHVVEEPPHRDVFGVVASVLDLLFGLLYALLFVRFLLVFFGARPGAGFYQLIHGVTEPFYRPFEGLFATSSFEGWRVEWSILVAIAAYAILHWIIRGVLRLVAR